MTLQLHLDRDALFLDIDGTLLDMAPTPDKVVVPKSLLDNLHQLYEKTGGALALISGRGLEDIDRLFSPLILPAAGSHGAELRLRSETRTLNPLPTSLLRSIEQEFLHYPEIILEVKTCSVAIHYRQAPDMADTIRRRLQDIVSMRSHGLTLLRGKMVFEIVYHDCTKGTAIEYLMKHAPFIGRKPVFLGDDETDVFAINVCHKLGGVGVMVRSDTPQYWDCFSSPKMVREWISRQAQ